MGNILTAISAIISNSLDISKSSKSNGVQIADEKLENPQNPAELINCKVIKYFI